MWWLVDNYVMVLFVLALVAFCLGAVWWSNRRGSWFLAAVAVMLLMLVVVGLSLTVVTDSKQLAMNVAGIRDAVNSGKMGDLVPFCANEITVELGNNDKKVIPKAAIQLLAMANKQAYGVSKVETGTVQVDELARPKANVQFMIVTDEGARGRCFAGFEFGADGKWRVNRIRIEAAIGGQTVPVLVFPFKDPNHGI
jgi:hypothetical protein